ncbi:unnamed protein product [Anisakis simplex]|uniref:AhpC-TSA domain-containing protein n=1 Tax=Anisakis simplex TaxID=6269 RepID=A0A0M3JH81_ANISI|nr:unnamed protein product [Anisakis simplex]
MVVGAEMGEAADIRVPDVPLAYLDDEVENATKSNNSLVFFILLFIVY